MLRIIVRQKHWQQARALMNEMDQLGESHPANENLRCEIEFEEGRRVEVTERLSTLLAMPNPLADTYTTALRLYILADDNTRIDGLLQQVMISRKTYPGALGDMVWVLDKSGRIEQSRELLTYAKRLFPNARILQLLDINFAKKNEPPPSSSLEAPTIWQRLLRLLRKP